MSDPSGGGQEPTPEATDELLAKPQNKEIIKIKADKEFVKEKHEKPEKEQKEKVEKPEKDKNEQEKPKHDKEKHEKEKQEQEKPKHDKEKQEQEKPKHDKEKHEQEGKAKHDKESHKEKHDKDFAKEKNEVIEKARPDVFKDPGEFGPPGNPLIDPAAQLDPQALLANAADLQESLRHFIEQSQRPDLSEGALKDEPDQPGKG